MRWGSLGGRTPGPHDLGHLVCIGTYCCGGGWLTAMDAVEGEVWQADREGKPRWS